MADTNTLDQQLDQLQTDVKDQTAEYESSAAKLRQNFVDAYLWWRDASQEKDYLSGLYTKAGIKSRKRNSNRPNFYPLVRLVWKIDISKKASTVSNWTKSMLALHEEYAEHSDLYESDARQRLINFIIDEGGLSGLRGERQMTEQELIDAEEKPEPKAKSTPPSDTPPDSDVVTSKREKATQQKPLASMKPFGGAISNQDGFMVLLARKGAKGQIEIVGSGYDDNLVQSALLACTNLDRAAVMPSLRLLAECIEPHALSAKLEKYRKKFFDTVELTREVTDENGQTTSETHTTTQATALRIRPKQKDILVSKSTITASVVTFATPKTALLKSDEVIMRGSDRNWIESELIGRQKLSLYASKKHKSLVADTSKLKADYKLEVETEDGTHKRNLYFYKSSGRPKDTSAQASIADADTITYDWKVTANTQWLTRFDAECMNRWLNEIKGFFNAPRNLCMNFVIGKKDLTLEHWWDGEKKAYQRSNSVAFDKDAKADLTGPTASIQLHPKDAAFVFTALPHMPIANDQVILQGNEHLLRIDYATDLADYTMYLPAVDHSGKRDETHYELYGNA